jgi:hypothetical protein
VHVGIAEQQPVAGRTLDAGRQRMHLAEPAGGELVDPRDRDPVIAGCERASDLAGPVGRAIVDDDDLDGGIAARELAAQRVADRQGFVARRHDHR